MTQLTSQTPNPHSPPPQIHWPLFNHALGDPHGEQVFDLQKHEVVIVEGIYMLLKDGKWGENVSKHLDCSVYIDGDFKECMELLERRNQIIPGYSPEEIKKRVLQVDTANARLTESTKPHADKVFVAPPVFGR